MLRSRFLCCFFAGALVLPCSTKVAKAGGSAAPAVHMAEIPLHFEANQGQMDARVPFRARGSGYSIALRNRSAVLTFGPAGDSAAAASLEMRLAGSNTSAGLKPAAPLPGKVNYFVGRDPSRWRRDIPTYARVEAHGVYPGIDLIYYGNQRQLEYDFMVAPGADPGRIRLEFAGARKLEIEPGGGLRVEAANGYAVRWRAPAIYQGAGGERREIAGRYELQGPATVGFAVAEYDRRRPLVIDPVLEWSTALGGVRNSDYADGIAVDSSGNVYVTGYTSSEDFPVANAAFPNGTVPWDIFVTKFNPAGASLVYSTYVGGTSSGDYAYDIAVDSTGAAYFTGQTSSTDFPMVNAAQPVYGGSNDAFVAKLNSAGNALVFSTYLGGSGSDTGRGIAVDLVDQSVYVTGYTNSSNFPLQNPLRAANAGNDAFLTRLNAAGNSRLFSTYLGGNNDDYAYDVVLDSTRVPYIGGYTFSSDLPVFPTPGIQPGLQGMSDCFVMSILVGTSNAYRYSQYLGGTNGDYCTGIAVDSSRAAYVVGYTYSGNFPLVTPIQSTVEGGADILIAKIAPAGSSLAYSTFWGGSGFDYGARIAVDPTGRAHIVGYTDRLIPTTSAIQPARNGSTEALYKSTNSGSSWTVPYPGGPATSEYGVVINPVDPSVMYAGNFYKYGGGTWTYKKSGIISTYAPNVVAFAPSNPSVLYLGTYDKIYRSDNAADLWQEASTGLATNPDVRALVVDPTNSQIAYAGTWSAGVQKTTNGGAQWTYASSGLPTSVYDLAIHPGNPSTVWAAVSGSGVYRTINGGSSWTASNTGISSMSVTDLAVAPSAPTILYAVAGGNVYKSGDGGATWTPVGAGIPWMTASRLAVDPTDPNIVYAATSKYGLWKTTDGGATWSALTNGLPGDSTVNTPAVDPSNPAVVYAPTLLDYDAVVAVVNAAGTAFVYATYLGGAGDDRARSVATDAAGATFVAGYSASGSFPTTNGTLRPFVRPTDAFVAKLTSAQPACAFRLVTNPSWAFFPRSEGTGSVSVVAPSGCSWTATGPAWVRFATTASGTGVKSLLFSIGTNTGNTRAGAIAVNGAQVPVAQAGSACTYSLGSTSRTVGAGGGAYTVTVNAPAGCPWNIVDLPDWVTVTTPLTGAGDSTIGYTVAPSTKQWRRTTSFTAVDATHRVNQNGTCTPTMTPTEWIFAPGGGAGAVQVNVGAGCSWYISNWPNWVTMNSPTSATGDATINYTVSSTTDAANRNATFYLYGQGGGLSFASHSIRQNGTACSFTASPAPPDNAPASGAERTFQVYAPGGCRRSMVSDVPWLSVGSGATGDGNGTISYAVAPNPGGARMGTISTPGFTFTVNQAGGYSGPSFDSVTPSNGSGSVQTFEARYSHTAGATALKWVQLMFAVASNGGGESYCLVHYDRNGNALWLYSDIYGFFAGPAAPGVASSALHGSLCAVDTQNSSVQQVGNQLIVRSRLVFKQNTARRIYLRTMDQSNVDTNWREFGSWTAQIAPGSTPSVTPLHGATALADLTATFPDPPGFSSLNLGWVEVLIAAASNGGGQPFCFVHYDRAGQGLWLYSNDVGFFVGPVTPGKASTLLNSSACQVNTQQSSATEANPVSLRLVAQLKAAMAGLKKVYLRSYDSIKVDSGWLQSGHWTIPAP